MNMLYQTPPFLVYTNIYVYTDEIFRWVVIHLSLLYGWLFNDDMNTTIRNTVQWNDDYAH